MLFAVLKPDKTPMERPFLSMGEAQEAIAAVEPDILLQGMYQIHPISGPADAERINIKMLWKIEIEKRNGDDQSQPPVETIVREGVN